MGLRATPEERAAKEARKADERMRRELIRQAELARQAEEQARYYEERERLAYLASPPGQARQAREAGQRFFQLVIPIEDVDRTVMAKLSHEMTTRVQQTAAGIGALLTAVEDEGWELIEAGYVFRETAQASRDKLLTSGQQIATIGQTLGIYLFKVRL